jgi:hypothetical protein
MHTGLQSIFLCFWEGYRSAEESTEEDHNTTMVMMNDEGGEKVIQFMEHGGSEPIGLHA